MNSRELLFEVTSLPLLIYGRPVVGSRHLSHLTGSACMSAVNLEMRSILEKCFTLVQNYPPCIIIRLLRIIFDGNTCK